MQKLYMRAMESLRTLRDNEEGQAMVEYGLLVALISVVAITALIAIGGSVNGAFETVKTALESAGL